MRIPAPSINQEIVLEDIGFMALRSRYGKEKDGPKRV